MPIFSLGCNWNDLFLELSICNILKATAQRAVINSTSYEGGITKKYWGPKYFDLYFMNIDLNSSVYYNSYKFIQIYTNLYKVLEIHVNSSSEWLPWVIILSNWSIPIDQTANGASIGSVGFRYGDANDGIFSAAVTRQPNFKSPTKLTENIHSCKFQYCKKVN